ncbi:nucleolar GTP-binding protein 2-like [Physella acuta]|uniref:nucleolar GTP-binding protein 2-like n=1 Tax=Physella acuta TaxID=109671 RepID=UPI0027DCB91B|nr:nucleolar GTP-binding protein 2-like [Physella acuta]
MEDYAKFIELADSLGYTGAEKAKWVEKKIADAIEREDRALERETSNKANHSLNPDRPKTSAGMRDRSTINRLKMYKNFKPKRDRSGRIVQPAPFQSTLKSGTMARVEPNRKWFGNTSVVTQNALQAFNEAINKIKADPYKVVMNPTKNPVTLLSYTPKAAPSPRLLDREPFEQVFGKKATRKKPTLSTYDLDEMVKNAETDLQKWEESQSTLVPQEDGVKSEQLEIVFKAGTSKRIWNELYKVIDSSDVIVQVLDARDPAGTRCRQVENYLKKEKPHKHLLSPV